MFLNCSTCFGRHTAHHQELKNCNCSLWFYVRFWLLSHRSGRQPKTYVKPKAAITVFELLMMSVVSLETCWAIKKHWNNKFYYTVASCWFFSMRFILRCTDPWTSSLELFVVFTWETSKAFPLPYECCFSCTNYEALYVYVMGHVYFYNFQNWCQVCTFIWVFVKSKQLPENTAICNVKLYDLVELVWRFC